ncbi:hypothetical protein Aduo_015088 [Ancylostoma duodenale]
MVTSKVNSDIRRMIAGAVEQQLNPLLQKLKQKMVAMGYTKYDIEWTVQDSLLRVVLKPKSWNATVAYREPNNSMLCLTGIMPALFKDTKNQVDRAAATNGTDFTCVAPKFDCEQTSCSVCADLDLVASSDSTYLQLCDDRSKHVGEVLTLTITPQIWNLLDTKAHVINKAVTSIKFPDFVGKEGLNKYRVWGTRVDYFTVPKSGASFKDFGGGVHSTMDLQFGITTNLIVHSWIIPFYASMKAWSEHAFLDVRLVWNDFKLTPYVFMFSKIHVDINHGLLNLMRKKVGESIASRINSEVPTMVKESIERDVNPRLQQLKQKLISKNFTEYDIDWKVQNKSIRVALKPKSWNGVDSPMKPMNDMMCIDLNVLAVIGEASKLVKKTAATNGVDFTCVNPKFNCEGSTCSLCADVDFNMATMGSQDNFFNCLPRD